MNFRNICLGHLDISTNAKKYVMEVLDNNRLSAGPFITMFEEKFAHIHSTPKSLFTASGTCALTVALAAMIEKYGFEDGDEVLVPAITFVATSNIVLQLGMKPVFVDVDPQTYNINPNEITKHITTRTKVIIPVHLFGLPCDMDPILEIANQYNLHVIEDSCETMFVRYKGKPVGSFGEFGCFSTYVAHLLITGVGGLITMKNESDDKLLRSIMQHGRDSVYLNIDDDDGIQDEVFLNSLISRRFSFVRMGYSFRVTEMEGALGLAALEESEMMMTKRKKIGEYYTEKLSKFRELIQLPYVPSHSEHAYMMYPLMLLSGDRDKFALYLEKNGVETRYMMPLLNQPYYKKMFGDSEQRYPVAKKINDNGLYIPCHQGMTTDDVDYVSELIQNYFKW